MQCEQEDHINGISIVITHKSVFKPSIDAEKLCMIKSLFNFLKMQNFKKLRSRSHKGFENSVNCSV